MMRELTAALGIFTAWYWMGVKMLAGDLWTALPGPWPVKLLVVLVLLAIPGPQDELLLVLFLSWRKRRLAKKLRT
jgi:hypothetical protein